MIVISNSLSLSLAPTAGLNGNNPLIGWHNLASVESISATTEQEGYPASNLANPATNLLWKGDDDEADEYITIGTNYVDEIDYVAVARHNFGTIQAPVSIEGTESLDTPDWVELVQESLLGDDSPALFRFVPQSLAAVRIKLQPGTAKPSAAVVYAGKLLIVSRRLYVGHTPINYGRVTDVTNGRSETGEFLGRIVVGEYTETSAPFQNLSPSWYRTYFEPFVQASKEAPFFFAWRPGSYPREVGYCALTSDPKPANQRNNGMMQVEFQMRGVT